MQTRFISMEEITKKMQNDFLNKVIELQYCEQFQQTLFPFAQEYDQSELSLNVPSKTRRFRLSQMSGSCLSKMAFPAVFPI
jgi:hypothetical protein